MSPPRPLLLSTVLLLAASGFGCKRSLPSSDAAVAEGENLLEALQRELGTPIRRGNQLELLENGAVFDAAEEDIRSARSSIHVVVYIWRGQGQPSERLGQAILDRRPGVACRLVIDPFGSLKFDDKLEKQLRDSGCQILRYDRGPGADPLARTHRKIFVVDGKAAITGGFGVWRSWLGNGRTKEEWRDTAVRVRGPVVADLQKAFEQNWRESLGGQGNQGNGEALPPREYPKLARAGDVSAVFVATSPRPKQAAPAEAMFRLLIQSAKRRLWIANSYFIPDHGLQALIVERRRAGVDVRVLAPGPVHDVPPVRAAQRATYETLIDGGVRIFEYEASMMHSKTIVVDDSYVMIGSTNMDALSFEHLEEGSLIAHSPSLARTMAEHFRQDCQHAKEITPQIWDNRDLVPDIARRGASLLSDWL
jgi:cardiolipin synthase